jgi:hypothetical protein
MLVQDRYFQELVEVEAVEVELLSLYQLGVTTGSSFA